jgi:hypothetical protein
MTSLTVVYDAFLAKILDDEWDGWTEAEVQEDLGSLLDAAIEMFKFPRVSLSYADGNFAEDLTNSEVQILATYMKCEWLDRNILTWENVKPLYIERDFSQANLLSKFRELLETEKRNAAKLEAIYYRSIDKKPYDFTQLARQDV